jgi:hypothetical protein
MKLPQAAMFAYIALSAVPAAAQTAAVYLTEGCSCCHGWIEHLETAGFDVAAQPLPMEALTQKKMALGLAPGITSCHTAMIDGYVFEGHVPADLVQKFLREKPDAIGLTVPGMPMGSPGMGNTVAEAYQVLLVNRNGTTTIYATSPADK